jgi:hypothetical protein
MVRSVGRVIKRCWSVKPRKAAELALLLGRTSLTHPRASSSTAATPLPSFAELEVKIKKAIDKLGGDVFPKLNWSSPRDVPWIMNMGTLKCSTPGDVFLLLKSSEFVTHDLTMPFDCCVGTDDTLVPEVSRPPWMLCSPGGKAVI